ncbi:acetyltransferase [[Clostridium] innocuum]|nr:acetyltransferase [[Clostridium] innocuum]
MKELIIIGIGGHGKVIADIAYSNGYKVVLFLDDIKKSFDNHQVVGTIKDIDKFNSDNYEFIVAIGKNKIRKIIQKELITKGFNITTLIHPSVVISPSVKIGKGTVVMANCVINAGTLIGEGCIINTASTIDHDCIVHDFVHISPGVHIAGTVEIRERTWIGIGSSIKNNIKICEDCIFGAGSVVIKDIFNSGTYVGVPVKKVKG